MTGFIEVTTEVNLRAIGCEDEKRLCSIPWSLDRGVGVSRWMIEITPEGHDRDERSFLPERRGMPCNTSPQWNPANRVIVTCNAH